LLQLCQVIGWSFTGGVDLAAAIFVFMLISHERPDRAVVPLFGAMAASLAFAIGSFATAHCLYVYENLRLVRIMSFIGLTPLSAGAVFRIPLSIATQVWLHRPDVQQSFASKPWLQTQLGHAISGRMIPSIWRGFWTMIWCTIWTALWGGLAAYIVNYYEIPRNLFYDAESHLRHIALLFLWLIGFWGIIRFRHRTRRTSAVA
jgi:hypothetical protein